MEFLGFNRNPRVLIGILGKFAFSADFAIFPGFFQVVAGVFKPRNRFFNLKIDFEVNLFFVKMYKMLSFRYRKIDFGCLKWSRMIPGTK